MVTSYHQWDFDKNIKKIEQNTKYNGIIYHEIASFKLLEWDWRCDKFGTSWTFLQWDAIFTAFTHTLLQIT